MTKRNVSFILPLKRLEKVELELSLSKETG